MLTQITLLNIIGSSTSYSPWAKTSHFEQSHESITCSCCLTREGWKDSNIKISQSLMNLCHSGYTRQMLTFLFNNHSKICWDCRRLTAAAVSRATLLSVCLKQFITTPEEVPLPLWCCIAVTMFYKDCFSPLLLNCIRTLAWKRGLCFLSVHPFL